MEQYDEERLKELLDNINKIRNDEPHLHIDELASLSEEGLKLCDMMEGYYDERVYIDEQCYFEDVKQCGSTSPTVRLKMKRREDFEIVMDCIGNDCNDKQIIDIMTLNLSQSQIDSHVVTRVIRSMKKNNITAKDAFNLIESRLPELKKEIHEKLQLKNKPHVHLDELLTLYQEAEGLCSPCIHLGLTFNQWRVLEECDKISKTVMDKVTSWKDLENIVCRTDKRETSDEEKILIMLCKREITPQSKEDAQ